MGKSKGASVNLDSFLDIMTCLVGVLVLIIILTGLDAAQIRVLIPTPMEYETDKRPIFIEARNNQLYMIPVGELQQLVDDSLRELSRESGGNIEQLLTRMQQLDLQTSEYRLDLTYFMVGQFGILPREDVPGYSLQNWEGETSADWYGRILGNLNPEEEMLAFLVRDNSFEVFKLARHLAWVSKIDVAYELLSLREPIRFGMLGQRVRPQ
jgi:hypothetical protein